MAGIGEPRIRSALLHASLLHLLLRGAGLVPRSWHLGSEARAEQGRRAEGDASSRPGGRLVSRRRGGTGRPFAESASIAGVRLAKYLARAGVASRRAAERLIADGKVRIGGEVVRDPARDV